MALGNSDEIDQSFVEIRMPKLEGSKDKNDDVEYVLLNCDQLARKKDLQNQMSLIFLLITFLFCTNIQQLQEGNR